jgi:hypothetical protein
VYFIDRRNADTTRASTAWESLHNDQHVEWSRAPIRRDYIHSATVFKLWGLITVLYSLICDYNKPSKGPKCFYVVVTVISPLNNNLVDKKLRFIHSNICIATITDVRTPLASGILLCAASSGSCILK